MQMIDHILSPLYSKSGNYEQSAFMSRLSYDSCQLFFCLIHRTVNATPISRLCDENIRTFENHRISHHCGTFSSQIAGKAQRSYLLSVSSLGNLQRNCSRTENVPRIIECKSNARQDLMTST